MTEFLIFALIGFFAQIIDGSLDINGETLNAGDGAAISEETALRIRSLENNAEFLLFDLN